MEAIIFNLILFKLALTVSYALHAAGILTASTTQFKDCGS